MAKVGPDLINYTPKLAAASFEAGATFDDPKIPNLARTRTSINRRFSLVGWSLWLSILILRRPLVGSISDSRNVQVIFISRPPKDKAALTQHYIAEKTLIKTRLLGFSWRIVDQTSSFLSYTSSLRYAGPPKYKFTLMRMLLIVDYGIWNCSRFSSSKNPTSAKI